MGKGKSITVGYRYFMGLFMGICHECDALLEILAADRSAWRGEVTSNSTVTIYAPNLFGGDEKEGGLAGQLDVQMGRPDQGVNSYLEAQQGSPQPGYRGFLSLVYRGQVAVLNPYIKAWAVRVRSILKGWENDTPWYPETAPIPFGSINLDSVTWRYLLVGHDDTADYSDPAFNDIGWSNGMLPFGSFHNPESTYWNGVAAKGFATTGTEVGQNRKMWLRGQVSIADVGQVLVYEAWKDNQMALYINGHLVVNQTTTYGGYVTGVISNAYLVEGVNSIVIMARDNESTPSSGNFFYIGVRLIVPASTHQTMNPAHIIYQALTNSDWGMGYPTATIDDASFRAAADLFFAEGMGLCFNWNNQTTIQDFCQIVADHASLAFGQDRRTGLFRMLPLRGNYDEATLPVFTKDDVRVLSYQRPSMVDTVNEIIIQYTDIKTGKDASTAPLQNLANIQGQGRVVSQTLAFPGIPSHDLAVRVGLRELQARSVPLWKFQLEFQRGRATTLLSGEPWILDLLDTEVGVRLVMRAGEMDYGNAADAVIRAPCIEDVFGLPSAGYVADPGPGGALPDPDPKPATATAFEAPHVEVLRSLTDADFQALPASACFAAAMAIRPSGSQMNYNLNTRLAPDNFAVVTGGDFTPSCAALAALGPSDKTFTYDVATGAQMNLVQVGQGAFLGEGSGAELVRIDAIDTTAGTITLGRGCADTVTAISWPAGTRLWVYEEADAVDPTKYVATDVVDMKVTTKASGGELPLADATQFSVTMQNRRQRPYPPGKLRINGAAYPTAVSGSFTVTWAHRNRDTQGDVLVDADEAAVTPASNTRYGLRLLDSTSTLLIEKTNIGPGTAAVVLNYTGDVTLELYTIDNTSTSWQRHRWTFAYTPPAGTVVTAITATPYTPVYDGIIVDGGA